jgi:hypothetical protein
MQEIPPSFGELFTTPRERECNLVKLTLRLANIRYIYREERRQPYYYTRYCVYVLKDELNWSADLVEERLQQYEEDCRDANVSCWA